MISRHFVLLTFLAITSPGCCFAGGSDTSSPSITTSAPAAATGQSASCDIIASVSNCRDMGPEAFVLGEDLVRGLCTGTYAAGGTCPVENRVGSCDEGGGTLRRYYSTGGLPYTADTARTDCQMFAGSTFIAN